MYSVSAYVYWLYTDTLFGLLIVAMALQLLCPLMWEAPGITVANTALSRP